VLTIGIATTSNPISAALISLKKVSSEVNDSNLSVNLQDLVLKLLFRGIIHHCCMGRTPKRYIHGIYINSLVNTRLPLTTYCYKGINNNIKDER